MRISDKAALDTIAALFRVAEKNGQPINVHQLSAMRGAIMATGRKVN